MHEQESAPDAARQATSLIFGFAFSQMLGTAVRLGLPDLIGETSKTVADLAAETGTDHDSLRRLMRALAQLGVVTTTGDDSVELTPLGRLFRGDAEFSLHPMAALYGDPAWWRAWGSLEASIRTGAPGFDIAFGSGFFDHLDTDPALAGRFHRAMSTLSRIQIPDAVRGISFSPGERLVDVGGGDGTLLAAILAAEPSLHGTVFDTEGALSHAEEMLRTAGVADRADAEAGDFFESVPAGRDVYLLKNILHDWDDESCVRILRNCRTAVAPTGRILVVTALVPDWDRARGDANLMTAFGDMEMLVMTTGRERTIGEYERLFEQADLRLGETTTLSTELDSHLVTALPR
ncbi:SAM-dependent methyltransferase [Actinoalloteichus hoggarensis]|uniref:Multifunctional cyclase-dehydratase-3-O-methyl transferase TcmN n=2 Tax=Actinoalloteichus hoggarensis TaxID=1470176 RepID=A0A221W318_9PSEU|nr:methyltransferase [Actinoalloteichus hoggarensis]ASO20126.1 Multifunctional cyclase-dehydratase-3-O-methyl transferase TcmN [Actinoalloteichus hoggarensis]MBB5919161.1 SAM-dependent methyltransferase [Actinoalloteichus hoggarensis]